MIIVELPTLVDKLNSQSKLALEQAAAFCMSRQNPEVTIEHFLHTLIDNPLADISLLLKMNGLDLNEVRQRIGEALPRQQEHEDCPSFSPLLVELMQDAWLLASATLSSAQIRSGIILLAMLNRVDRYLPFTLIEALNCINRENLSKNFYQLTRDSSENSIEKPNDKKVSAPIANQDALNKYCEDITEKARQGELDPVLCRDNEINLMIDILLRRRKNNPIVVGEAGVGKSALIEGLAQRIVEYNVPETLKNVSLIALDLGLLQAGASVKGEFEKRLKNIIQNIKDSPTPIILFIDEAHSLIGAGNQEGSGDAANLLKPALARGELCAVAATTWKEYKKYFEKDPALTRRFELVKLKEPSPSQAVDILRGLHATYERAHNVLITDEGLKAAALLSSRYLSGRQLPDKAIDVLDTACARVAINLSCPPTQLATLQTECHQLDLEIKLHHRQSKLSPHTNEQHVEELQKQRALLEKAQEELRKTWQDQCEIIENMLKLRQQILCDQKPLESIDGELTDSKSLQADLAEVCAIWEKIPIDKRLIIAQVDAEQIANVIADWTGVPLSQMQTDELDKIIDLPSILAENIIGQDVALSHIHKHLLTARADLRKPGRPKGAFLLVGPSGVGKTETVLQLAEQLYGGKQFLTTINMSEYQEKYSLSRLIGSPPGYVGYGEGGVLTEAIRKMPYSVVLLDEVEKAHPEVLNLFYQGFDKGELADGEGRLIDCQNIVFFLTSNLGYQTIVDYASRPSELDDKLYPELCHFFKPALLARMEIVPYLPLGRKVLEKIVKSKLHRLEELFDSRYSAKLEIAETLIDEILRRTTRSENGARMLEAIIDGQLLPPVSAELLKKLANKKPFSQVVIGVNNNQFTAEVN